MGRCGGGGKRILELMKDNMTSLMEDEDLACSYNALFSYSPSKDISQFLLLNQLSMFILLNVYC